MNNHYNFLKRWYKHSRFEGRNGNQYPENYSELVYKSSDEYLKKHGHAFISCHDSNTGQTIKYNSNLEILGKDAPPVEYHRQKGHLTHLLD